MVICYGCSNIQCNVIYVLMKIGRSDPHCSNTQAEMGRTICVAFGSCNLFVSGKGGAGDAGP